MANAHPRLVEAARYLAPSNREHGVVSTLAQLLDAPSSGNRHGRVVQAAGPQIR